MGKKVIAVILCGLLLAPGGATAADGIAFASADTQAIATKEDAPPAVMPEFSLADEDILAWEESEAGQYVYIALSAEKSRELAGSTAIQAGQKLRLNIGDDYVLIPEVASNFRQQDGLLLTLGDSKRQAFVYSIMDRAKRRAAVTAVTSPIADASAMAAPASAAPQPLALPASDEEKAVMKEEKAPEEPDSNP